MDSHSYMKTPVKSVCLLSLNDKEQNHVQPLELHAPPGR